VGDREVTAQHVVDRDRTQARPGAAVDQHHGGAARGERLDVRSVGVDRGEQHTFHPLLFEQVEVEGLAPAVLGAVAQVHGKAGGVGRALHPPRDVGEERVGPVEHDVGEGAAAAAAQLAGRLVAHEAQLVDRGLHPPPHPLADQLRAVDDVGHRAERDAGARRHVLHARSPAC
jgi:hypothetical protein